MAEWNPKDVKVIINGLKVTGFAEDSIISFSPNTEKFTVKVGAGGQKNIEINPDDTATGTISLAHNSPINRILLGLYKTATAFSMSVIDLNSGASQVVATDCYANLADNEKSRELSDREWEIIALNYEEL